MVRRWLPVHPNFSAKQQSIYAHVFKQTLYLRNWAYPLVGLISHILWVPIALNWLSVSFMTKQNAMLVLHWLWFPKSLTHGQFTFRWVWIHNFKRVCFRTMDLPCTSVSYQYLNSCAIRLVYVLPRRTTDIEYWYSIYIYMSVTSVICIHIIQALLFISQFFSV